jgi:hypothetical protein
LVPRPEGSFRAVWAAANASLGYSCSFNEDRVVSNDDHGDACQDFAPPITAFHRGISLFTKAERAFWPRGDLSGMLLPTSTRRPRVFSSSSGSGEAVEDRQGHTKGDRASEP